jgi:hypothetical protein
VLAKHGQRLGRVARQRVNLSRAENRRLSQAASPEILLLLPRGVP